MNPPSTRKLSKRERAGLQHRLYEKHAQIQQKENKRFKVGRYTPPRPR